MPRLTVTTYPALSDEPVNIGQLKAQVREDSTEAGVVDLLGVKLQAARDVCERHCGRLWTSATVAQTFDVGEPYTRLPGAGDAISVTGYYTDLADLDKLNDTGYNIDYLKGITVSRDEAIGFYGTRQDPATFTVTYPVTVTPEQVPPAVKEAILKLAAELYENRESSASGTSSNTLLAVSYRTLLAPYVLTNPLYQ